jgi:hypothetical protein
MYENEKIFLFLNLDIFLFFFSIYLINLKINKLNWMVNFFLVKKIREKKKNCFYFEILFIK